jgi:hypothetical protein
MNISDKYYASFKDSSDLIQSQVHTNRDFIEPCDIVVSVQQSFLSKQWSHVLKSVIRNSIGLIYN